MVYRVEEDKDVVQDVWHVRQGEIHRGRGGHGGGGREAVDLHGVNLNSAITVEIPELTDALALTP